MNYWLKKIEKYKSLAYAKEIKYQSWQPARWASNSAVIERINKYFSFKINESIELGAGSSSFSFVLNQIVNTKINSIDNDKSAFEFSSIISKDLNIDLNFKIADFFTNFHNHNTYDLVLSSGVVEHFNDNEINKFIEVNKTLSHRYIFIAIPNQESWIFSQYIKWVSKNSILYDDEHKALDINMLETKMRLFNLKILCVDGFHVFLSESKFWNEMNFDNYPFIFKLKQSLISKSIKYSNFPKIDFTYEDISILKEIENELTTEERLKHGFMNFILAEI